MKYKCVRLNDFEFSYQLGTCKWTIFTSGFALSAHTSGPIGRDSDFNPGGIIYDSVYCCCYIAWLCERIDVNCLVFCRIMLLF